MNCAEVLRRKGYDLRGYSLDTYYYLTENDVTSEDECESLLGYLEMVYG
jgi:hypothetical protein